MHRAACGAEQLLVRNRGSATVAPQGAAVFCFHPFGRRAERTRVARALQARKDVHPSSFRRKGVGAQRAGMQRMKQRPSPSIPFLLRKGEEKHALRKGEAEPGDASRHLPHNVNKREVAGVKKCERVPKPRGTRPVRFSAGGAAAGIGTKAASFHPSFWLTGPLARGFRIRGLHFGHSQPVDQFPQAQRNST